MLSIALLLGAFLVLVVYARRPALLAGLLWSTLPIWVAIVPTGYGLAVYSALLLAIVARRWREAKPSIAAVGWILLLVAALWVTLNELGRISVSSDGLPFMVAIVPSLLLLAIGTDRSASRSVTTGVIVGTAVLSLSELLRVAQGGQIHSREVAFGLNPIALALYAATGALILIATLHRRKYRAVIIPLLAIHLAALVATASRGPIIAFAIFLLVGSMVGSFGSAQRKMSPSRILATYSIAVLGIAALSTAWAGISFLRDDLDGSGSSTSRTDAWKAALAGIMESPLFGNGPGNYAGSGVHSSSLAFPHNVFLELWSEHGIVPFGLTALALLYFLRVGGRRALPLVGLVTVAFSVSGTIATTHPLWSTISLGLILARAFPLKPSTKTLVGDQSKRSIIANSVSHTIR